MRFGRRVLRWTTMRHWQYFSDRPGRTCCATARDSGYMVAGRGSCVIDWRRSGRKTAILRSVALNAPTINDSFSGTKAGIKWVTCGVGEGQSSISVFRWWIAGRLDHTWMASVDCLLRACLRRNRSGANVKADERIVWKLVELGEILRSFNVSKLVHPYSASRATCAVVSMFSIDGGRLPKTSMTADSEYRVMSEWETGFSRRHEYRYVHNWRIRMEVTWSKLWRWKTASSSIELTCRANRLQHSYFVLACLFKWVQCDRYKWNQCEHESIRFTVILCDIMADLLQKVNFVWASKPRSQNPHDRKFKLFDRTLQQPIQHKNSNSD